MGLSWVVASLLVMGESSGPGPRGKVGRLLEVYGFEEFGDYLVNKWTAEDSDARLSLRALAREFNIRLLEERLAAVNEMPVEGTVEHYFESLNDDAVSSGVRTQVRRNLEQAGIDVAELEEEFVSRQAIHTYLAKTRNASKPEQESSISNSSVRDTIDQLRERVRQVTASRLDRLKTVNALTLGEFRVLVDVQVYCEDCGTQQSLTNLLTEGGCKCHE